MLVSGMIQRNSPQAIRNTKIATYPTIELKKELTSLIKILRMGKTAVEGTANIAKDKCGIVVIKLIISYINARKGWDH
jgi:hypothetical protein